MHWNVWYPKSQRLILKKWNIKSSGTDLKMRCIIQKWSNVMYCKKAKWKASKFCNHFCGKSYMFISIIEIDLLTEYQLCMTWLNWSLKLHSGLWTIPHLILTHNTQDFCSTNAYFICVIVHDQMWCVYLIACQSNPKRFLSILYVFESVFMHSCSKFLLKMHCSCFSSKTSSKAFLREARD